MLRTFLGNKFNQYISGSSIRRVHSTANIKSTIYPTTYPSDPRNLGLSGPVVELPTGAFHWIGQSNDSLLPQADTLHTLFHESFHIYEYRYGYSILRDFGNAASWSMPSDLMVRVLAGCVGRTCDPEKYRKILVGLSSQDSSQTLSTYGVSGLHEDFAETSAQFAEIWLAQNGFPIAAEMYKNRETYYDDNLQRDRNLFDLSSTLNWLEGHYGRHLQTTFPH